MVVIVEAGTTPSVHGVVRWRLIDLAQWVWNELHLSVSSDTLSRELRRLCYRKLSAWPRHHAQPPPTLSRHWALDVIDIIRCLAARSALCSDVEPLSIDSLPSQRRQLDLESGRQKACQPLHYVTSHARASR